MDEKTYGYIRVSTREQNEDRQLIALQEFPIPARRIFMDKMSGKDFQQPQYQRLLRLLKPGNILVVKSIDRLGRNYQEILEQWRLLTKQKKVHIVVLDMPLLDTRRKTTSSAPSLRTLFCSFSPMWPRQSGKISASARQRASPPQRHGASKLAGPGKSFPKNSLR